MQPVFQTLTEHIVAFKRRISQSTLYERTQTRTANIHVLTDQAQLDYVLELFREKYGSNVQSYYPKYDVAVEVPLA